MANTPVDPRQLLAALCAAESSAPDLLSTADEVRAVADWIGRTAAHLTVYDPPTAARFKTAASFRSIKLMQRQTAEDLLAIVREAITALEIQLGGERGGVFGPGAVYDFANSLREVVAAASSELLIVDPYMDSEIIPLYVSHAGPSTKVRLLTSKKRGSNPEAVEALRKRFVEQTGRQVELRHHSGLHDRVVFVDDESCWVIGASIKDAAKSKTTYLAPLYADLVPDKRAYYEELWETATAVQLEDAPPT